LVVVVIGLSVQIGQSIRSLSEPRTISTFEGVRPKPLPENPWNEAFVLSLARPRQSFLNETDNSEFYSPALYNIGYLESGKVSFVSSIEIDSGEVFPIGFENETVYLAEFYSDFSVQESSLFTVADRELCGFGEEILGSKRCILFSGVNLRSGERVSYFAERGGFEIFNGANGLYLLQCGPGNEFESIPCRLKRYAGENELKEEHTFIVPGEYIKGDRPRFTPRYNNQDKLFFFVDDENNKAYITFETDKIEGEEYSQILGVALAYHGSGGSALGPYAELSYDLKSRRIAELNKAGRVERDKAMLEFQKRLPRPS